MTKKTTSELSFNGGGWKNTLNVTVEADIDIDDFVKELHGSSNGIDIGEKLLYQRYDSILELAQGLNDHDMSKLVTELLDGMPDHMVDAITDDYCMTCAERQTLSEAVEEIEEERSA